MSDEFRATIYNPTEIHEELRNTLREWSERNLADGAVERDASRKFDRGLFLRLGMELGLFGVMLPKSVGGTAQDFRTLVLVIEELSRFDASMALSYLAQELLFCYPLYGAKPNEIQQRILRRVLDGEAMAAMAMTEPEAGTDVLGMTTSARISPDGYVLNGRKQWITNAPVADYFLIYARTGENRKDISLFLVEKTFPGLTTSESEIKMGMRSSPTGMIYLQDCRVPKTHLVGSLNGAVRIMMKHFPYERLALSAQACGISMQCLETMTRYAVTERKAFGKSIADFGQIQRLVSESYARTNAARAFLYATASQSEQSHFDALCDAVKLCCSECAENVSRNAIQVLGANGYSSAYEVERMHRDAILLSIGGGTNEAMQKNIMRYWQKKYGE